MTKKYIAVYLAGIGLLFVVVAAWYALAFLNPPEPEHFNGERALTDVETQVAFGPRIPGSAGHAQAREWMRAELSAAGWDSRIQMAEKLGHPIQNIIAHRGDDTPKIILGAHYDTRMFADNDPDPAKKLDPVPGANDGASGVAVLLVLARVLPEDSLPIWLVFFDAEDNGRIEGWDWILGSQAFVDQMDFQPKAVIIVDMIGDADLNIYYEVYSDTALKSSIWAQAAELGYGSVFIPQIRWHVIDDHTPFLEAGISAVDIIDLDCPYWHTTEDTVDKVSAESLEAVGRTLQEWLANQTENP